VEFCQKGVIVLESNMKISTYGGVKQSISNFVGFLEILSVPQSLA